MTSDQTIARTLHDVGAAAWFGGALMGAVGLHGASSAVRPAERVRVADAGWAAWTPWKGAAIAAHVAGSLALVWGNKGRLAGQRGAMTVNLLKTGVFGAAVVADLRAASLGRRIGELAPDDVDSAVEPSSDTSDDEVVALQRQLRVVQWVVPALTALNIAIGAKMGEQQRPTNVAQGLRERLSSLGG